MERPQLDKNLDRKIFLSYYFLKEELTQFCRSEGLQPSGGKADLTRRIAHYLATGEKLTDKSKVRTVADIGNITESDLIESNFVCSEKHREFFTARIGKGFSFIVAFQKWLKANAGKTYSDAIEAYHEIMAEKKIKTTVIDKQFEYNVYIRDFFADNKGKSIDDAIRCWKHKKSLQGHNRYERSDLTALD
jgi:hypothetical protein